MKLRSSEKYILSYTNTVPSIDDGKNEILYFIYFRMN
jgi:hypothetical protein